MFISAVRWLIGSVVQSSEPLIYFCLNWQTVVADARHRLRETAPYWDSVRRVFYGTVHQIVFIGFSLVSITSALDQCSVR